MNSPIKSLAYVSPYAWVFWVVFLFVYVPEFRLIARSRPEPGQPVDHSMTFIMLLGWIGFPLAFGVANWSEFVLARHQKLWFWLGILSLVLGSALRRHCFKTLGRYFTGNVKVTEGQTVIQNGAYRWVRHPSYTGGMLMYLGTGFALTNWLSAMIIVLLGGLGYAYRVRVEEKKLSFELGETYRAYMQRTKRFVPFIF